ncbi:MAG: efflux RND transporter periplasmic adaptor subunit [Planctomycetota bacterium]|jgi:RND family efflux transporter MFP subunit
MNMVSFSRESRRSHESANGVTRAPSKWLHLLIAVMVLAAGAVVAKLLIASRKPPPKVEQKTPAPLVEIEQLQARDIQMVVRGFGTVSPKVQVEIVPQVSGNVVFMHPQFKAGGFVRNGERLVQIDPRDYELSVQQAQALVADAQVKLDQETAEGEVARREWEDLNPGKEPTSTLVLREPQIRQAEAKLKSAEAQLAVANLSLKRTHVSLPIDVVVISERADLGQFVSVGQSIGTAYGIDAVEIKVPLEDAELAWFDMGGNPVSVNGRANSQGTTVARVKADFAGTRHIWTGCVKRTVGEVDKTSRRVSVVVEVPEPFKNSDSRPPLLPGTFVEVIIEGKTLKNAVAVPRDAVRNANEVWVVEDGRLYVRPLSIVRTDKDFAYAVSGVGDRASIVVSSLDVVVDAMAVRTGDEPPDEPNRPANKSEKNGSAEVK